MTIIPILLGVALLFLGRKLFWLFVAVVGFVVGTSLASQFLQGQSETFILIIGLLGGVIGALLAIFMQRLAVAAAGFVAGGYLMVTVLGWLGMGSQGVTWLPFLIGGVIGALLVAMMFDWALIFLSSLVGAELVVNGLGARPSISLLLLVVLLVVGMVVQSRLWRK
jgi:hypothetical protein